MAPLFRPSSNTIFRLVLGGGICGVLGLLGLFYFLERSPYRTGVLMPKGQPVPFSHQHHVAEVGLDCRYCHFAVEKSSFAGIPPVSVCMNCHRYIWSDSPMLAPVRDAYQKNETIAWNRVHQLAQFVYFNHSVHISKGVGCSTCHGRVDQMPLMWKVNTLHMNWCLECHRNPEKFIRPKSEVFNMKWEPPKDQIIQGTYLKMKNHIESKTDCYTCHR